MARRSETTLSSFEEVHTPIEDLQEFHGFNFDLHQMQMGKKSIEGPRGPHLFRSSVDSTYNEHEEVLGMSPMTPRPSSTQKAAFDAPQVPQIPLQHQIPFQQRLPYQQPQISSEFLDLTQVETWTPEQVASWMYDAGFEESIVEKFEENDISGAILTTLKFEDLRELNIPSFGTRTRLWNEIHVLRDSAPNTPKQVTPIEEIASPCTELQTPARFGTRSQEPQQPSRKVSKRRQPKNDIVTPMESVSIVGIEQLMPKPHKCPKGENCAKWRKQQRLIANFNNEHPVSPDGGYIWVAGNPGNALTTAAIADGSRPISDAVPSVVASSDAMGSALPQFRHLEAATLRDIQLRDPQDNVKQFLQFQHIDPSWSSEQPPTPPYEMFPTLPTPHSNLRSLPRLAIPPPRAIVQAQTHAPPPRSASANAFSPYPMERGEALSPDLRNASEGTVYRFGTPFSEMDVPVTAVALGPVAREASQSVPPNMNYRAGGPPTITRSMSRSSARRPSFAAMPRVDEYLSSVAAQRNYHPNTSQISIPPTNRYAPQRSSQPQTQQTQFAPAPPKPAASTSPVRSADDVTHAGAMKKRKTKMLRHEWHEHHFTLKGTRLAMHKDATAAETLEYIDVDDYAIACSSLASGSKLNAAFKAMSISRSSKNSWDGTGSSSNAKKDETAFAFQLIPAALEKGAKIKKRESMLPGAGVDAGKGGKTHYFAVRSRDDRIDWMRELMLAKALKQKSEGFEINVNGNMI